MTFYAERKSIKTDGTKDFNNRIGEYDEMLRQYFLYCAGAINSETTLIDAVEFGTVEQGAVKREVFNHPQTEPEPEPEPEPDQEEAEGE